LLAFFVCMCATSGKILTFLIRSSKTTLEVSYMKSNYSHSIIQPVNILHSDKWEFEIFRHYGIQLYWFSVVLQWYIGFCLGIEVKNTGAIISVNLVQSLKKYAVAYNTIFYCKLLIAWFFTLYNLLWSFTCVLTTLLISFADVQYEYFHAEGGSYVGQDYMCHV